MKANQSAHEIGQLAWDMVHGYAAHIAAIRIAPRLDHRAAVKLIADHPSDSVQRKDGTKWERLKQMKTAESVNKTQLPRR